MKSARRSIRLFVIATALAAAINTAPAETAEDDCNRECLRGFITQYLNAMVAHTPGALPVAATIRFTEDTVDMKLGEGLWKQASKIRPTASTSSTSRKASRRRRSWSKRRARR